MQCYEVHQCNIQINKTKLFFSLVLFIDLHTRIDQLLYRPRADLTHVHCGETMKRQIGWWPPRENMKQDELLTM
jgi:hypothetical protein